MCTSRFILRKWAFSVLFPLDLHVVNWQFLLEYPFIELLANSRSSLLLESACIKWNIVDKKNSKSKAEITYSEKKKACERDKAKETEMNICSALCCIMNSQELLLSILKIIQIFKLHKRDHCDAFSRNEKSRLTFPFFFFL